MDQKDGQHESRRGKLPTEPRMRQVLHTDDRHRKSVLMKASEVQNFQREAETSINSVFVYLYKSNLLYNVSQKVPPLTCYNLYIHDSIATIFGTNVAENVRN